MEGRRFYVGATFARYAEVRAIGDALVAAGHDWTYDWTRTAHFGADGRPAGDGYDAHPAEMATQALGDLRGVRTSDVCLFLGQRESAGWPAEFGAALAYGVPDVWVVAPWRASCFWHLPQVELFAVVTTPLRLLGAEVPQGLVAVGASS